MEKFLITVVVLQGIGLVVVLICYSFRLRRNAYKLIAKEAFFFHKDLQNYIEELEDSEENITDKEWEIILEIARFADKRFLQKYPHYIPEFQNLEEEVAEIINERRETR